MLKEGLLSTLKGELILQGILAISGNTAVSILVSEYFSKSSVTEMLEKGYDTKRMARELLLGIDYEILLETSPEYKCNCSFERMERALVSIGEKELSSIIEEQGSAELKCHFCQKKYNFDKEHLTQLLEAAKK